MADGAASRGRPAWGGPGMFAAEKRRIERHQREMQRRQAEHLARLKRRGELFSFWLAGLSVLTALSAAVRGWPLHAAVAAAAGAAVLALVRGAFRSRLEAQNTKIDAQSTQTASLKSEIASLRWMIGLGFTLLALLITLLRFLG